MITDVFYIIYLYLSALNGMVTTHAVTQNQTRRLQILC